MREQKIRNIIIDNKNIDKNKINHFYIRMIESRLNQSNLSNQQKIEVIDKIIVSLQQTIT